MFGDVCYGRTYDGAQKSLPPDKLFDMVTMDMHMSIRGQDMQDTGNADGGAMYIASDAPSIFGKI